MPDEDIPAEPIEQNEEKKTLKGKIIFYFHMLRKYFVIEPLLICWILPSCFFLIAIQNLGLEKACRVNLGYNKFICDNVLEKSEDIDCDLFKPDDFKNITGSVENATAEWDDFALIVCKAERDTQKSVNFINGIRGPISSIFPIIVILYAGGWSDKYGLRKPCMLLPMIGEVLSASALLISSIYFDTLPMEFGNLLEKVLPALLGGSTLMVMGIYSYLIATTKEEDRVFRLGIFGMCLTIISIIGIPFSGVLYSQLGYTNVFTIGICILLVGILYLIFCIDEVKQENKDKVEKSKFSCIEGIMLAFDCVKVLIKKRENNGRFYILLLAACYFLIIGPTIGEIDYLYQFSLIRLSWNGEDFSYYNTYSTAVTTAGTFIMTTILSKLFKITDPMVGIIASICSVIARVFFAFSKNSTLFYVGGTFDMFVTARTIALKTVISTMVLPDEIGRLYSILGIADALGSFIFAPIYSAVYTATLDTFPGAFYLFGEIFFIPSGIIFVIFYFIMRNRKPVAKTDEEAKEENGIDNIAMDEKDPDSMNTHL